MILTALLLQQYLYGSNKIMWMKVFWYSRIYCNGTNTLLYHILLSIHFLATELLTKETICRETGNIYTYNSEYRILSLVITKLMNDICHSYHLGQTLQNWRCLEDKLGVKPLVDIPSDVLHTGGAWKLLNGFILIYNIFIGSPTCMRTCAEILLQHPNYLCLEKGSRHTNKCSQSNFGFQARRGVDLLYREVGGMSGFNKELMRR